MRLVSGGHRRAAVWTLSMLLLAALAGCSAPVADAGASSPSPSPTPSGPAPLSGSIVRDSWGNVDFYTPVATDSLAQVADHFELSPAKLAQFNSLSTADPLTPGKQLRLIPPPVPITGAMGHAVYDADGIPVEYTVAEKDTTGGLRYRFGLTQAQLAAANHVDHIYEQGNVYYLQPGKHMWLQKGH